MNKKKLNLNLKKIRSVQKVFLHKKLPLVYFMLVYLRWHYLTALFEFVELCFSLLNLLQSSIQPHLCCTVGTGCLLVGPLHAFQLLECIDTGKNICRMCFQMQTFQFNILLFVCLKSWIFKAAINAFNLKLPKHEILLISLKWDDSEYFFTTIYPILIWFFYLTLLLFAIFIQFPCPYHKGKGEFQRYLSQKPKYSVLWSLSSCGVVSLYTED